VDLNSIYSSISLILPEVIISITLVLIVLSDLIFPKYKILLPLISITGLILCLIFLINQYSNTSFAFASQTSFGLVSIDKFGSFFKLVVIVSSLFVVLFSISSKELAASVDRLGEYYSLIMGMILGMMFLASATDLIFLYLSMELLSLSSYVLAGFTKSSLRNSEASLKYVIYGSAASGTMLFGISIFYGITGTTNIYLINSIIHSFPVNHLTIILSALLIIVGMGFKISAAPFHFWTPDVYEGSPITITAFLSVASKAAGFAVLIRFIKTTYILQLDPSGYWTLFSSIDWKSILVLLSVLSMTLGNFAALWQNNLKRMLAYSSIAHAGYILLGLTVLSDQGISAILIYFGIYAFMNLGAFFIVMLIADKIGSEDLDDYRGIGYSMPFLGISLAIFFVSLTGLPPTAGFIAKLYIFIALVDSNMIVVAVIALLNSVVSLYYYIRVLKNMFLERPSQEVEQIRISLFNSLILLLLLAPILIFGVYFTPLVDLAKNSIGILGF
jgi:NADH-quinone oxidoreductase subunit N